MDDPLKRRLEIVSSDQAPQEAVDDAGEAQEIIEDYLDHQIALLVGLVGYEERRRLRRELAYFIENDVNDCILEGHSEREAVLMTVKRYGDSRASDEILSNWQDRRANGKIVRRLGLAQVVALIAFGFAHSAVGLLEQIHIDAVNMQSNPMPVTFGLSPAQIRSFIPHPLPLPERSGTFGLLLASLLLLPIAAGVVTGWFAPVRAVKAIYHAQTLFLICSFVEGILMLPACYGLLTACCETFYWLPVGCLCGYLAGLVRRYRNSQYSLDSFIGRSGRSRSASGGSYG